jgi:transposase
MKNSISNFLEIQGYKMGPVSQRNKQELVIRIIKKKSYRNKCPDCGGFKTSRHAIGKYRLKKHGHYQEKIIYLEVKRDGLICLKCRKVFAEELPDIKKYARKSDNFFKQSLSYLAKNSFNEVGMVNKVGYQSLKNSLYNHVNPFKLLDKKIKLLSNLNEIFLGIDGQSFRGQEMVLTVTEVKVKELLTILPSELQIDLKRFLEQIPLEIRAKVKAVAMDMTNKHWRLLKSYLPRAKIVIDHYHAVSCSLMHLQKIRTTLQAARNISIPIKKELNKNREDLNHLEKIKLRKYFKLYPELLEGYLAKEKIRSFYRLIKHQDAKDSLERLIIQLKESKEPELQELGSTLSNWQVEILNYLYYRITNAYTEGLHTKCKLIKRKSFGFRNVETYIRKLILGLLPISFILNHTHFLT